MQNYCEEIKRRYKMTTETNQPQRDTKMQQRHAK